MMASVGKQRLKVIFFAQRFPYPIDAGGKIRTGKTLEYLRQVFDITFICNIEHPKDDACLTEIENLCSQFVPVAWQELKKYSLRFYLRVLGRLFSRYPITVANDYSQALEAALLNELKKDHYDLVICDFVQPSLNCWKVTDVPMLLFQHNVEAVIPRRHAETTKNPLLKLFWLSQWKKMERFERAACHRFHGVVAVSEHDKRLMQERYQVRNVYAIPTGVDTGFFTPCAGPVDDYGLVFTGSLDWLPNEDALLYFAHDILGLIKAQVPQVALTVVGRNPSQRLVSEFKRHPEIRVVGWVRDVRPYVNKSAVYIIPLRIGGGTRIKAYEAMAMGKPVVSTTVGVEGLPIKDGKHVLLADNPQQFATAVIRLLQNGEKRRQIGTAARAFVEQHFSWQKAGEVFASICHQVVDGIHATQG